MTLPRRLKSNLDPSFPGVRASDAKFRSNFTALSLTERWPVGERMNDNRGLVSRVETVNAFQLSRGAAERWQAAKSLKRFPQL